MTEISMGALDRAVETPREQEARRLVECGDHVGMERLADAGLRHRSGAAMEHAVGGMLEIARALTGGTTRDGSWGELEKRFAIMAKAIVRDRKAQGKTARPVSWWERAWRRVFR